MRLNKRNSKRRYPEKICKQCNLSYIPKDARQVFCSPQHRIDYNNDKRKVDDKPYKELKLIIKRNFSILQSIFNSTYYQKHNAVHESLLLQQEFQFNHFNQTHISSLSGNKILFTFDFGLEFIGDENNKIYKIHKK